MKLVKIIKPIYELNQSKNIKYLYFFWNIYFESLLFISMRAFLPSLRVLKTSQDREDTIKTVSIVREKKVMWL